MLLRNAMLYHILQPNYKKAYQALRNNFKYDVTKTDQYKGIKDLDQLADVSFLIYFFHLSALSCDKHKTKENNS